MKHTSEALCKAAFTNEHASFATKAVEGSSKSQAQTATWAMAEVITRASEQDTDNLKRPLAQVEASGLNTSDVVDDFHINTNMFDETQLWLKAPGRSTRKKRRRVLASATQVTRRARGGTTTDADVLRAPATMKRYTAATCAGILGKPEDSAGLLPEGEAAPKATYIASLTATDSHSVNRLVSKWISESQTGLGPTRVHVPSYCTQHKTGNAVQQVSEYLGLIRPGFALASCLQTGEIAERLDFELRMVLELGLDVVDPAVAGMDARDETDAQ